jgi:hypothetical protein
MSALLELVQPAASSVASTAVVVWSVVEAKSKRARKAFSQTVAVL